MRLYIARHGETLWNREKRLQGSTDVELNEKGIALAELTGKALAQVPFHRVFASPLKRAVVTARLMTGGRELPFETDERLERNFFWKMRGLPYLSGTPQKYRLICLKSFFRIRLLTGLKKKGNPFRNSVRGPKNFCRNFWRILPAGMRRF